MVVGLSRTRTTAGGGHAEFWTNIRLIIIHALVYPVFMVIIVDPYSCVQMIPLHSYLSQKLYDEEVDCI